MKTMADFKQEAKSYLSPNIYDRTWPKDFVREYICFCHANYCSKSGNAVDLFFDKDIKDQDGLFGQYNPSWMNVPYIDISLSFNEDVRNNDMLNFEEVCGIMSTYFHEQYHAHDEFSNFTLVPPNEQHYYQMSKLAAYGSNYDTNYTYEPFELKAVSSGYRGGMRSLRGLGIPPYYVDYGCTANANKYQMVRIHDAQTGFSKMWGYSLSELYNSKVNNMTEFFDTMDYCYGNAILGRIPHNFSILSYKDYVRNNSNKSGIRFQQFLGDVLGLPVGLNGRIHSRYSSGWYNDIVDEYAAAAKLGHSFNADRIAAGVVLWYSREMHNDLLQGRYPALRDSEFYDIYSKLHQALMHGNESEAAYFRDYFMKPLKDTWKSEELGKPGVQETEQSSVVSDYESALSSAQEQAVDIGISGGDSVGFDFDFER